MVLWERGEASEAEPCFQNHIWPAHCKYIVIVLDYILCSLKLLIFRDIHEVTFKIVSVFVKIILSFHNVMILDVALPASEKKSWKQLTFF